MEKKLTKYSPHHNCFPSSECAGCAFELGVLLAEKKPNEAARYVWMVVGSDNPCDIRRYEFSHEGAVAQLSHAKKSKYKDQHTGGTWKLFKLVQVRKTKSHA